MRAEAIAKIARLYPLLSGCGTIANHPVIDYLAGRPSGEAWAKVEGGKLLVSLDDYVGRAAFYVGDLDRKISVIVDRFVKPGDTVLDIGANIGLVTLRLSKRVGRTGIVHAFEPNPQPASKLASSIVASDVSNVRVHQTALGSKDAILPLTIPAGNVGMGSLIGDFQGETVEVPVRRLDDFDLGPVAFVKMDVEGFEDQVLLGAERTLRQSPPKVILFEQNTATGTAIQILRAAGYRVAGVSKSLLRLRLNPVSEWSSKYHDYVASI